MATLIPPLAFIEMDALPNSERQVLNHLNDLEFPGLEVYFSLPLVREKKQGTFRSEADFILFHPAHGILVWEVKGGGISFQNSRWYTRNNSGTYPVKDPVKQADNAIGDIITRIKKIARDGLLLPIGRNLVFPDTLAEGMTLPMGLLRADIIDHNNLQDLDQDALKALFARWPHQDKLPISKADATFVRDKVLNPTFHLAPAIDATVDQIQSRLVQLTNQQVWALELLRFVPRLTITGGAGTGKTLLARQKARDLASEGKNVLALCFNKALAEHLYESLQNADDQLEGSITASSFHDFARHLIERAGTPWAPPEAPADKPAFYEETVPTLLADAASVLNEQYDALLVDEAQDFHPLWWMALYAVLKPEARVVLFADPSQNLYGRDFEIPSDVFDGMLPYPFQLMHNCRNSLEIAQWLNNRFGYASVPAPNLPAANELVKEHAWKTIDEQTAQLAKAWEALRERGVKPGQLAVLSPYRPENSGGIRAFEKAFEGEPFVTSTINSYKGLQSPFVFLVDMNTGEFASREDLWYVGATRATVGLQTFARTES
ncbi:MAG TPA: hypothetical protein DHU56_06800 [Marinobacter sp.]|nr:hypothetical protein [Marinobacter sp.]